MGVAATQEKGDATRLFRCFHSRCEHQTPPETVGRRANSSLPQEFDERPERRAAVAHAILFSARKLCRGLAEQQVEAHRVIAESSSVQRRASDLVGPRAQGDERRWIVGTLERDQHTMK